MGRELSDPPTSSDGVGFYNWLKRLTFIVNAGTVGQVLSDVPSAGSSETDLLLVRVLPNFISKPGDALKVEASGAFAASANNKRVRVRFGSTVVFDSGALAISNANTWDLKFSLVRVAVAAQRCHGVIVVGTSDPSYTPQYVAGTESHASSLNLRVTGEGGANGDVVLKVGRVEFSRG